MTCIKFGRYIATLMKAVNKEGEELDIFRSVIDHEVNQYSNLLPIDRALKLGKKWLDNHYGFILIYLDNVHEEDHRHVIKLCNYKKFKKEMDKYNLKIKVENFITAE